MKLSLLILGITLLITPLTFAQEQPFQLKNVMVIGQQNNISDRYSLEGGLVRLFTQYHIKAMPSLNIIKEGGSPDILMSDSIRANLKEKGIDTYLLVSIRGYDKRFSPSKDAIPFEEAIKENNLFELYRDGVTRVTFSFKFYHNLKLVHQELIRTGSVGSADSVMKKLLKEVSKRIEKDWK